MKIIDWILNLLYPAKCTYCRKLLNRNELYVCKECENSVPYTKNNCITKGNFFTSCVSPLYYEDMVREALLRYKFYRMTTYSKYFGKLIAECVNEHIDSDIDFITWVPLSKQRLRKRGYDQAQLLAMEVATQLSIPCVPLLRKTRNTSPQSRAGDASKRRTNISGAYIVMDKMSLDGKTILLIDDIVTTGSTLSECARVLGMNGADKVYCATVARKR